MFRLVTYLISRLINAEHEKYAGELNEGNALAMFPQKEIDVSPCRERPIRDETVPWERMQKRKKRVYTLIVTFLGIRCNSIMCLRAAKMALYDDSLETSVTSTKRHNSPYKVDFMGKLTSFPAGILFLRKEVPRQL